MSRYIWFVSVAGFAICAPLTGLAAQETDQADSDPVTIVDGPDAVKPASDDKAITVTGSRLPTGAASEPIQSIFAEDIEKLGVTTTEELLRRVTANTPSITSSQTGGITGREIVSRGTIVTNLSGGTAIDLRGLGAGSTLVLLNGRRLAGEGSSDGEFADISGIPIDAIERIDILTAGASAIYGADAVAGVVNIILRKDYTGTNITVRYGDSSSGADDFRISATTGFSWGNGNISLSGSYARQKEVSSSGFGFTTRDLRSRGGLDNRTLASPSGAFFVSGFDFAFLDPDDFFANNALLLPAGSGPIGEDTDLSAFQTVSRDDLDEILPENLAPDSETISLSARLTQDFNSTFLKNASLDFSIQTGTPARRQKRRFLTWARLT